MKHFVLQADRLPDWSECLVVFPRLPRCLDNHHQHRLPSNSRHFETSKPEKDGSRAGLESIVLNSFCILLRRHFGFGLRSLLHWSLQSKTLNRKWSRVVLFPVLFLPARIHHLFGLLLLKVRQQIGRKREIFRVAFNWRSARSRFRITGKASETKWRLRR